MSIENQHINQDTINEENEKILADIKSISPEDVFKKYAEIGACTLYYENGDVKCVGGISYHSCQNLRSLPDVKRTSFQPGRPC